MNILEYLNTLVKTELTLFFLEEYCFSDSGSIFLSFGRFEAKIILKIFLEYRSIVKWERGRMEQ